MDASALNPRNTQHVRSKSVPSNSHPIISQVDEQLRRLRDSEATSSSLCHRLGALQNLYDCVDKLLVLPLSQQELVQVRDKEVFDDLLEGSLKLLDLCDTAKIALLQTRECTHELESVLRRRRSEICTSSSLQKCLSTRQMIKKAIRKVLKGMESKQSNKDKESFTFVNQIKEVEAVTYHSIVSLLSFIEGPKLQAKWSCWSSVSKLVQSKKVTCISEETNMSVIERLDSALSSITNHQSNKDFQIQVGDMQNLLRDCGASIKEVEEELEGLYRFIIKTRVSLLNIFNY